MKISLECNFNSNDELLVALKLVYMLSKFFNGKIKVLDTEANLKSGLIRTDILVTQKGVEFAKVSENEI